MSVLPLIFLGVCAVYSDSHSLRYYFTGVSGPGSRLPVYSIVGYIDDHQTDLYTTHIGKRVPVAQWLKENESPEHWEYKTRIDKNNEAFFKHEVKILMKRFNHTEGFHYVQVMTICTLQEDGSTVRSKQYRYDNREYMFYDTQTATFIPTMAEAQMITQRWNSPYVGRAEWYKHYMDQICDWLTRYIEYGRQDLEHKVRPEVKVSGRESDGVTKLHCQVYGFHPRAVDVKWMKNGIDQVPSYQTTHVLPNPDGTYQIRVTVDVIPQEGGSYSCYVDHSSLEEPLLVRWEPNKSPHRAVIISVITIVLVLISVTSGLIIYRRRKRRI